MLNPHKRKGIIICFFNRILPMLVQPHALTIPIANWTAWDAGQAEKNEKPDVSFVEPMLRRRLSPLARIALCAAHRCAGNLPSVRFVYASRHGELDRTLELLQSLASNEPLSPTTFGLSVLNASAGLYSILRGDQAPATAIAAGPETFTFGLIEACSRAFAEPGLPVLYVYADAPAPAPFGPLADDPADLLAIALLIDSMQAKRQLNVTFMPNSSNEVSPMPQATAFLASITDASASAWAGAQRCWQWNWQ